MAGSNLKGSVPVSDVVSSEPVPSVPPTKEVTYWAPAKRFQLGNFKPEIRNQADRIIQSEQSIRFYEHTFTTSDPEEIAFIESTNAFQVRQIRRCETRKETAELTKAQAGMKSVRTLHSEDISGVVMSEGK